MQLPRIGPEAVMGIEINAYAAELARVTIRAPDMEIMSAGITVTRPSPMVSTV